MPLKRRLTNIKGRMFEQVAQTVIQRVRNDRTGIIEKIPSECWFTVGLAQHPVVLDEMPSEPLREVKGPLTLSEGKMKKIVVKRKGMTALIRVKTSVPMSTKKKYLKHEEDVAIRNSYHNEVCKQVGGFKLAPRENPARHLPEFILIRHNKIIIGPSREDLRRWKD